MKTTTALLFLFCFSNRGFSQEMPDKQMVYNLTLDTTVAPDYYSVNITVAESIRTEKTGRKKYKAFIIPIDTLSQRLLNQLSSLGFNRGIQKTSITEVERPDRYYYYQSDADKKLFQVTYTFRMTNRDSIDFLFKNLEMESVSSMGIYPELYDGTIERVRQALVIKGTGLSENYASQIAQQMNQKIIKSKYNIIFYDGPSYLANNNFDKKFVINYRNIEYKLSISYTYTLADK